MHLLLSVRPARNAQRALHNGLWQHEPTTLSKMNKKDRKSLNFSMSQRTTQTSLLTLHNAFKNEQEGSRCEIRNVSFENGRF